MYLNKKGSLTPHLGNDDLSLPKGNFCLHFLSLHSCISISNSSIIIISHTVLLCSMSTSHEFTLKNYKDSWNPGPPWPECALCHRDVPSDASLARDNRQSDMNDLSSPLSQDPEMLSPQATEFYPTAYYQPYNNFGRGRPYMSLPSRRRRRPIRRASYHRGRLGNAATHYYAAAEATGTTNFGVNQQAGYRGVGSLDHLLGGNFQVWNSVPIQSQALQPWIPGHSYRGTERSTLLHQDTTQPLLPIPPPQLSLPGASVLWSNQTGFVSQGQEHRQPADPTLLHQHSPIVYRYPNSQFGTDHY